MKARFHPNSVIPTVLLAGLLAGCSPSPQATPAKPESEPTKKSTIQTAIDGATGKTAVQAHKKAKDTLTKVSAQRDEDLKDVFGENP